LFAANKFATRDVFNLLDSAINAKGPFKHRHDAELWMKGLRGEYSSEPTPPAAGTTPAVTPTVPEKKTEEPKKNETP
jgi:hypothetical protein